MIFDLLHWKGIPMLIQHCIVTRFFIAAVTGTLAFVASTAITPTANADVVDYSLAKFLHYQQTANNAAPTTLTQANIFAQVNVGNANDFTSVSVSGGDGLVLSRTGRDWEGSTNYGSQSALDAAFPSGTTYMLNASGALGSFSESIEFDGSDSFSDTPFFTGNVYSDAQGMNPSQSFTFTWNTPPADGFFLYVEEASGFPVFEFDGFGLSGTSAVAPAGTFSAGTGYVVHIDFIDATEGTRDSFQTGTEFTGYVSTTSFQFTPTSVPEPSSFAIMALGLSRLFFRRRSRARV